MNQIQELEKQLEQLRKQKRLENCIENLNRWKNDFIGKYYCTHTYAKAHHARLYRHFITEEQYNKLKNIVNNSITDILTFKLSDANGCDLPIDTYRSSKSDVLSKYGHEMIDLTPEEVYQLSWHPFVYGDQIINNEISLQMILDEFKKETNVDSHDVDFFVYGERVKRTGYHGKVANVYLSVINKMGKSILI